MAQEAHQLALKAKQEVAKGLDAVQDAVGIVGRNNTETKRAFVNQTRATLQDIRATKATDQSTPSLILDWAFTVVFERFPHLPAALTFYVATMNSVDSYYETADCSVNYQIVRWAVLLVAMGYLTSMSWKTRQTGSGLLSCSFLCEFLQIPVVFVLLLMVMVGLPPLLCHTARICSHSICSDDMKMITIAGAVGLVIFAVIQKIAEWFRARHSAYFPMNSLLFGPEPETAECPLFPDCCSAALCCCCCSISFC